MLRRELKKGNSTLRITLASHEYDFSEAGGVTELGIPTKKKFDAEVAKRKKAGYAETERSLSRRAFYNGTPKDGKFWIIELDGDAQHVKFGKLYSYGWGRHDGTDKVRDFDDEQAALTDYHKKIEKKLRDGYQEFHARKTEYATAPDEPAPPKKKARAGKKKVAKAEGDAATTAGESGARRFEYSDDTSSKFWTIELAGNCHTVTYGRIGTQGQRKTKEFADAAAANKDADKLVAQKTKKGYAEKAAPAAGRGSTAGAKKAASGTKTAADASVSPPVDLTVGDALGLTPAEWAVATWRKRKPVPLPEALPFDRDAACEQIKRAKSMQWSHDYDWSAVGIPIHMTEDEARFWYVAMTAPRPGDRRPTKHAREMATAALPEQVTLATLRSDVAGRTIGPEFLHPISALLSADELLDFILEPPDKTTASYRDERREWQLSWVEGMALRLPYLSDAERTKITTRVTPTITPANDSSDHYIPAPAEFYLGALVGAQDALAAVVEAWDDGTFTSDDWTDHYRRPQDLIFGLGDAGAVEHHMERLSLRLKLPRHVTAWLAHTELSRLDFVVKSICAVKNRDEARQLVEILARARAPQIAPAMMELKLGSKAAPTAKAWLERHVGNAIHGLVPVALGNSRLAEAAIHYLRGAKRDGHEAIIRAAISEAPADVAKRVQQAVLDHEEKVYPLLDESSTPKWLSTGVAAAAKLKDPKLPAWAAPSSLAPIVVGDRRLSDAQVQAVLRTLAHATLESPPKLLAQLRAHAEPTIAAAFAWDTFSRWLDEGAPTKHKWALHVLGLLGDDETALKLAPMIRVWPGESQHARAVLGLSCLRSIGSDVALMQLNGIAQKVKFKGLKGRARECMEEIAKGRKMTRAQLEDRIVPDCGLDENGSRVFDFGGRSFLFVLGPRLEPMVKDEQGKVRKNLPKPSAKDDAAKGAKATADWKLLKKQLREVGKTQVVRLEHAMVTGRSWTLDEFEPLLVRHPLMTHFARLVIWGAFDAKGNRRETFRVTDERDYTDADDEETTLDGMAAVRIVHPLELDDDEKAAWGELLGDYELIPPFPQLGRDTYGLAKGEPKAKALTRFAAVKLPARSLVGSLDRVGWLRGTPQDAGIFFEHSKPFYAADVTAIVTYPGVPIGYMDGWDDQKIEEVYFLKGIVEDGSWIDAKKRIPLGQVDEIVISEVLRDLTQIVEKA